MPRVNGYSPGMPRHSGESAPGGMSSAVYKGAMGTSDTVVNRTFLSHVFASAGNSVSASQRFFSEPPDFLGGFVVRFFTRISLASGFSKHDTYLHLAPSVSSDANLHHLTFYVIVLWVTFARPTGSIRTKKYFNYIKRFSAFFFFYAFRALQRV